MVDVNRQPGTGDGAFRPNQILAVGGLPLTLIDEEKAKLMMKAVEEKLLRPWGCGPWPPASRATGGATRAAWWKGTAPTTRVRSGPG